MTNEQQQLEIERLSRELSDLKNLFYKDNFSNLEVFRKKVEFKSGVTIEDITDIVKTGGTAVIADNTYTFNKATNNTIVITTKNGIITAITIT